jgi:hypothetical protein
LTGSRSNTSVTISSGSAAAGPMLLVFILLLDFVAILPLNRRVPAGSDETG